MNLPVLFGRLHPLVIHFPVALIVLAAAVEFLGMRRRNDASGRLVVFLLLCGALGAVLASATGWIFAAEYYPAPSERWMLNWHRWMGITTAAVSLLAGLVAHRVPFASTSPRRWSRRILILLAAVMAAVTAHFGALMVWGVDYFTAPPP